MTMEPSSVIEPTVSILDPHTKSYKDQLTEFARMVNSSELSAQLIGLVGIRKLSSIAYNPPLQDVIGTGVVPKLLEIMSSSDVKLQFESAWVILNLCSGTTQNVEYVVALGGLRVVLNLLDSESSENVEQAAWILGNIAGDNERHRDLCLQQNTIEKLITVLQKFPEKPLLKKNIAWALSNLVRGKPAPEWSLISLVLPVLMKIIFENEDPDILADALWGVSYVSDEYIDEAIDIGIIPQLVNFLSSHQQAILNPALKALGNIAAGNDLQMDVLLTHPDFLPKLFGLVSHPMTSVRKKACWIISNITAGTPQQIAKILETPHYLEKLMGTLSVDVAEVVAEISWCLRNLVLGADHEQMLFVMKKKEFIECLVKMLDCAASNSDKIHRLGLQTVHRVIKSAQSDSELALCLDILKTKGIMSKVEVFLESKNKKCWTLAYKIMSSLKDSGYKVEKEKNIETVLNEKNKQKVKKEKEGKIKEKEENIDFTKED